MGRPINKRLIGDPADSTTTLITATINLSGTAEPGAIVSQRSNRRYRVRNASGDEGNCVLVNSDSPGEGEMSVAVTPVAGGDTEYAVNINNRTVRTFDGNVYAWPENPEIFVRPDANLQFSETATTPTPTPTP